MMTSDQRPLQGACNPHSPAPLSPEERIANGEDLLFSELREARFRVIEQRLRGDELERQLDAVVEERDAWKRWAIFNGVGLGLMFWAWLVGK